MPVFMWLDLETTGLNEKTCQIIEVGSIITNENWEPLEEYHAIVNPGAVAYEPAAMGFHKKSGLYDEVKDGLPMAQVEEDLLALIMRYEPYKRRAKLAGNSIHFDRKFLEKYMPAAIGHLSHRHLDVSAIGALMVAKYGKEAAEYKAARPHRALPDLRRSIKELQFYEKNFLK